MSKSSRMFAGIIVKMMENCMTMQEDYRIVLYAFVTFQS